MNKMPLDTIGESSLNPKFTFDSFVVGESNQMAYNAARDIIANPGHTHNPFLIFGGVGLGKTHLMHAIGHEILVKNPEMRVLYVSSETITNELIDAIKNEKLEAFRNKYRTLDVLMVDDFEFFCGKKGTQAAILSIFKTLLESNKRIVLSSDCPPKKIRKLNEHLLARLESGLIVDIQTPDFDLRVAILEKKAQLDGINIPDDVLAYIASHIDSNIFKLLGALSRTVAYASLNNQSITKELAADALKNIFMECDTPESSNEESKS